jgi:predicted nucleic acid-binding protein
VRIVLDSSVVVEHDWNLAHNDAQALLAACDRGAVELFVPQVVIDEVVNRYERRESKKIKALNDARADLRNMRGPRSGGELEGEAESQPGYLMHLRKVIRDVGGEIPDFPEVSHKELVRRALEGRRPFNDAGRLGYRDTLIWHTVLEIARDGDTVVLATEDGDFRPADGADCLHGHLIADLRQRGIDPDRVSVVPSLAAVVKQVLEPALYVLKELNAQLDRDEDWGRKLEKSLKDVAKNDADHTDLSDVSVRIDVDHEAYAGEVVEETLAEVDDFRRFAIADAIPLDGGRFGIEAWLEGTAFFDVTVSTGGFEGHEGIPESIWISADETTAQLSGVAEVRLVFEVEYVPDEQRLGRPRLSRIEDTPEEPPPPVDGARGRPRPRQIKWVGVREDEKP